MEYMRHLVDTFTALILIMYDILFQTIERNVELQSLRELREIAAAGDLSARLTLCRLYAVGKFGGCPRREAASYVRDFVQSSSSVNVCSVFDGPQLTQSMRFEIIILFIFSSSLKQKISCF